MPRTNQIAVTRLDVNDARCSALFASGLQPSEFGDHPDAAAARMRWARQLAARPRASEPGRRDAPALGVAA